MIEQLKKISAIMFLLVASISTAIFLICHVSESVEKKVINTDRAEKYIYMALEHDFKVRYVLDDFRTGYDIKGADLLFET